VGLGKTAIVNHRKPLKVSAGSRFLKKYETHELTSEYARETEKKTSEMPRK